MKTKLQRFGAVLLLLAMTVGLFSTAAFANEESGFTDLDENAWYYDAVAYAYEQGWMKGTGDETFSPDQSLTRAMLVTILHRAAGEPEAQERASFLDVQEGSWYDAAISWASEKLIVKGYSETTFGPNDFVTREQFVVIVSRYAELKMHDVRGAAELDQFADAQNVSDWSLESVKWAVAVGLLNGKDDKIAPQDQTTRAEAAAILMRYDQLEGNNDADGDGIPAWLEEYLGSSDAKVDSDEDGIDDYTEVYAIGSDPAVADSNDDNDEDGLSNLEEVVTYKTNPAKPDTDLDGLLDGEEIKLGTDPLLADTDGDSVNDGDEVALDTNPLAPTDLSDMTQVLNLERVEEALLEGNAAAPSVVAQVDAVLNRNVRLEAAGAEAIICLDAVVGKGVELESKLESSVTLRFAIAGNTAALQVMELTDNGWVAVATVRNEGGVEAVVSHSGTYCVMDLDLLLPYLGVDVAAYYDAVAAGDTQREISLLEDASLTYLADFQTVPALRGALETKEQDLTVLVKQWLLSRGLSVDAVESYFAVKGAVTRPVLAAATNPTVADTDYDGISDAVDSAPTKNTFSGTMASGTTTSSVKYKVDYRTFFGDPTTFNRNLCTTSLVMSSVIYSGGKMTFSSALAYDGGSASSFKGAHKLLAAHGMKNTVDYKLTAATYGDDDLSEVVLGHRNVSYNGEEREVVALVVRGTNGTIEEWSSNFDMGNRSKFSSYDDWRTKNNHKGFDVAANRIMDYLETYLSKYDLDAENTVFWVTGHSRGAAIANIIAAKLVDKGEIVFAYTFAAPNTTTSSSASKAKYDCIFNLVNEDDFVPTVPMSKWNFTRYGRSATLDMTGDMESEWHDLVGEWWYNQMSKKNLDGLVSKLAGICGGWDACYKYTCSCHGDKSSDDIIQKGLSKNEVNNKIPTRAKQYCKVSSYKSWGFTKYKSCQLPAYFMQILAEITAANGLGNQISSITSYKLAGRYEGARNKLVSAAALGGIAHPHYCETYYLLSQYVDASDFN